MTKEQFEKYKQIEEEIKELRKFLRYGSAWKTKLIGRRFRIFVQKYSELAYVVELPTKLQDIIIGDIEKYINEREKELEEL